MHRTGTVNSIPPREHQGPRGQGKKGAENKTSRAFNPRHLSEFCPHTPHPCRRSFFLLIPLEIPFGSGRFQRGYGKGDIRISLATALSLHITGPATVLSHKCDNPQLLQARPNCQYRVGRLGSQQHVGDRQSGSAMEGVGEN